MGVDAARGEGDAVSVEYDGLGRGLAFWTASAPSARRWVRAPKLSKLDFGFVVEDGMLKSEKLDFDPEPALYLLEPEPELYFGLLLELEPEPELYFGVLGLDVLYFGVLLDRLEPELYFGPLGLEVL